MMIVYVDVLQDYNDHISELANKLVSIMDGVFDLSLSKVSVVSLTSTKRPNLLGNHILCRRFELYVHTHVHACTRQPDLYAFCTCTVLVHTEPTIPRTRELACSTHARCLQWEVKAPMPSLCFRSICKQISKLHDAICDLLPQHQVIVSAFSACFAVFVFRILLPLNSAIEVYVSGYIFVTYIA